MLERTSILAPPPVPVRSSSVPANPSSVAARPSAIAPLREPLRCFVRAAKPADVSAVLALQDTLFPGDPTRPPDAWFAEAARVGDTRLRVALAGDRVVGHAVLRDQALRPWTSLAFLGVDAVARGQGVAGALLDRAMGAMRRPMARLVVQADNAPARRLYESRGFVETARRDGGRALVMMRWLGLRGGYGVSPLHGIDDTL